MKDTYTVKNILNHRTAIASIDTLFNQGTITQAEKWELYRLMNKKYGFNSSSIFAA